MNAEDTLDPVFSDPLGSSKISYSHMPSKQHGWTQNRITLGPI